MALNSSSFLFSSVLSSEDVSVIVADLTLLLEFNPFSNVLKASSSATSSFSRVMSSIKRQPLAPLSSKPKSKDNSDAVFALI